jgi:putative FmdB family regulatory protein
VPIYEYRCPACDERFEELVRSSDASVACPRCGSADVERLLSVFAGTGGSSAPSDWSRSTGASRAAGGCGSGCGCGHHHH